MTPTMEAAVWWKTCAWLTNWSDAEERYLFFASWSIPLGKSPLLELYEIMPKVLA